MTVRKLGDYLAVGLLVVFGASTVLPQTTASASTTTINISLSLDANCTPLLNGKATDYIDITPGQSANIGLTNNSSYSQAITIAQVGVSTPTNLSVTAHNFAGYTSAPANGIITVYAKPSCSTTTNKLYLQPVSAALSCKQQGVAWSISGSFSNIASQAGMYQGGVSLYTYTPAAPGATTDSPYIEPATATATTFTLYDNVNEGTAHPIAQATCPAYEAVPAGSGSRTTPTPPASTTKTTDTAAPAPTAAPISTSTAAAMQSTHTPPPPASKQTVTTVAHTNAAIVAGGTTGLIVLAGIAFLLYKQFAHKKTMPLETTTASAMMSQPMPLAIQTPPEVPSTSPLPAVYENTKPVDKPSKPIG